MKKKYKQKKKIITCFTGEPRSFTKGLISRIDFWNKSYIYKYDIESRYLISFSNENNKSNNKLRILKSLKDFNRDKNLKSIKLTSYKYENIWANLISQKYEILCDLLRESNNIDQSIIILTRTDWFFSKKTVNFINQAIHLNKIIIPFITNEYSEFDGKKYKPMFDQFMVIPGDLIKGVIKAMEISIKIASQEKKNKILKNLRLGGDGYCRYGISPENLLGLGFSLSKLDKEVKVIDNFEYEFAPDMYGTNPHNLIRDDAHVWMNLSLGDFAIKYWWHLKSKLYKFIVKTKVLKIKNLIYKIKDSNF